MSDPPKKPGSLRDRIAAFEKASAAAAPPPPLPRPKPAGGASWKPKPPASSPPSSPGLSATEHDRKAGGMSVSDANESIGRGGSLKERMAALQGRGGFGTPVPPIAPKVIPEKPKYKPPPAVVAAPAIGSDADESPTEGEPETQAATSPPTKPDAHDTEQPADTAEGGEKPESSDDKVEDADPEEEERQRRAALAARMARLGGARVGMGAPVFGRPAIPKKPETPKAEAEGRLKSEDDSMSVDAPGKVQSADSEESAKTSSQVLSSEPAESLGNATEEVKSDSLKADTLSPSDSVSPPRSVTPTSMPIPAAPRRAAPPRRKPAKPTTVPDPPNVEEAPSMAETQPSVESLHATETPSTIEPPSDDQVPLEASPVDATSESDPLLKGDEPKATEKLSSIASESPERSDLSDKAPEPVQPTKAEEVEEAIDEPISADNRGLPLEKPLGEAQHDAESPVERAVEEAKGAEISDEESAPTARNLEDTEDAEEIPSPPPDSPKPSSVLSIDTPLSTVDQEAEGSTVTARDEEQAKGQEGEEDEVARRKRIAERVAKMGGFNPLPSHAVRSPPPVSPDAVDSPSGQSSERGEEEAPEALSPGLEQKAEDPAEEDEEEEAARRKRVAERLAKMGGFNPFQAPPPPARRTSHDLESPTATSPAASPALPHNQAVLRQDSVSSGHSADPTSPLKSLSRQASTLLVKDPVPAVPEIVQLHAGQHDVTSEDEAEVETEKDSKRVSGEEPFVATKEHKPEHGRSSDQQEPEERKAETRDVDDQPHSPQLTLSKDSGNAPGEAHDYESASSEDESPVRVRDYASATTTDLPKVATGPPAVSEPIPSPPPLPLKALGRDASLAERLPQVSPSDNSSLPIRAVPVRFPPDGAPSEKEDEQEAVDEKDEKESETRAFISSPISPQPIHPSRGIPPPPRTPDEEEYSDTDEDVHHIPPRNAPPNSAQQGEDDAEEEDDGSQPLPHPAPQHRPLPPPRHIPPPPEPPNSSGPSSPLEHSTHADSAPVSPRLHEEGTDEPRTPSQFSQPDDEALPTMPRLSTPLDTSDDENDDDNEAAFESEEPPSAKSEFSNKPESLRSPTASIRSPALVPSSLAPPRGLGRGIAVAISRGEVLDEEEGDPIDPSFHSPVSRKSSAVDIRQAVERIAAPASPAPEPQPEYTEDSEQTKRQTIAERMAKLGGIKFGAAPPPIRRTQPPPPGANEEAGSEAAAHEGDGGPREEHDTVEGVTEEEEEQARKRRIAAKLASMGGMRFGMLPPTVMAQRSPRPASTEEEAAGREEADEGPPPPPPPPHRISLSHRAIPPPPPVLAQAVEEERALDEAPPPPPRRVSHQPPPRLPQETVAESMENLPPPPPRRISHQPPPRRTLPSHPQSHETDSEHESQAFSDDGVHVEAEDSELEEVGYDEVAEEAPPPVPVRVGRHSSDATSSSASAKRPSGPPPPVPGVRPPIPSAPRRSGSTGSQTTLSPSASSTAGPSEYVMVEEPLSSEAEDIAPPPPPNRPAHRQAPSRAVPPPPPGEPQDLSASGQWELPLVPQTAIDFGNEAPDLSLSNWSEDSATFAASNSEEVPPPPPPHARQAPAPAQPRKALTSDDLMLIWGRVGVQMCEIATTLHENSKRSLVGDGSYEGFLRAVLAEVPNAAAPVAGDGHLDYGHLIYTQSAAAVQRRVADIMPGDVVVMVDAKFKGHKGLQSYSQTVGTDGEPLVGVVGEFETKKSKMRVFHANKHVGHQTVESLSYRLDDVKNGLIKVYRVLEA
ncbi:hypothetical protein HGRIS_006445 [Hohenbuehelia grisea]|uniref:BBC1/AIM3 cysteine proteinase-fold domain-containing protein n=1 Tax=Hohenbuehelia grisea TaxID=104357 RepID=A0ABR3JZZ6_9AGAR